MLSDGVPPGIGRPLAAGAAAAFISTLACSPLLAPARRARPLLPFSLYRAGLAALVIGRGPRARGARPTRRRGFAPESFSKRVGLTRF